MAMSSTERSRRHRARLKLEEERRKGDAAAFEAWASQVVAESELAKEITPEAVVLSLVRGVAADVAEGKRSANELMRMVEWLSRSQDEAASDRFVDAAHKFRLRLNGELAWHTEDHERHERDGDDPPDEPG